MNSKNVLNKFAKKVMTTSILFRVMASQLFSKNKFAITPDQYFILAVLSENEELYQRQISEITYKDRPNITRLLNILEKENCVKRINDKNKKKRHKIIMTDYGKELNQEILPTINQIREIAFKNVSVKDLETCLNVLEKIQTNIKSEVKLHT